MDRKDVRGMVLVVLCVIFVVATKQGMFVVESEVYLCVVAECCCAANGACIGPNFLMSAVHNKGRDEKKKLV